MSKYRIFQNVKTGEQFAVQIDRSNVIVGVSGPIHYSERTDALSGNWDADPMLTEDFANADMTEYTDVTDSQARA